MPVKNIFKGTRLSGGSDLVFDIVNNILMVIVLLVVIYPLIYILSASLSSADAVAAGKVWLLPIKPTILAYTGIFQNKSVLTGYFNSAYYMVVGTIINVIFTMMAAYPLARRDLRGRKIIMMYFMFTMMFSGGLIPTYMLIKSLHMIDTRLAMILPGALAVWNMTITRTYIRTSIPEELYESAEIDGAGDLFVFWKIVIPLSVPIIAVITLFYAVEHWNSYFDALIYIKRSSLYPLQIILRNILILNISDFTMITSELELAQRYALAELLKYSLIIVASLPMLLIYPFAQKYFIKGIMIGSIKG
ncbi:MAG: carbohydrate ABC transporter permease [Treponema sp.]|nr:carbohydrate ABC transporter permease [Treponema sp.]